MNLKDLEYRYGLSKRTITFLVVFCSFILWCMDSLLFLVPCGQKHPKQRVLVIKLDAIGDFILWLDFARGLRELYPAPENEILLVGNKAWQELGEKALSFDGLIGIDRMTFLLNPFYRFKKLFQVRRLGADIVIDPVFSREFNLSPAFVRTCGAHRKIGSSGDASNQRQWQKDLSDGWYTELLPASQKQEMELIRNANFLRQLGNKEFKAQVPVCPACSTGSNLHDHYYIIFPGAGWAKRRWPFEKFAEIASLVHAQYGLRGIICGGLDERMLAERIISSSDAPLDDMTGQTTLSDLASLIAGARFLVGNDTSAIHLAAAVSTPAICILGGGHFGRFLPYQVEEATERPVPVVVCHKMDCYHCNWICVHPTNGDEPVPCIARISVETVWRHVRLELEKDPVQIEN